MRPASQPEAGAPCSAECTRCSYGEATSCRGLWWCRDGSWKNLVPPEDCVTTAAIACRPNADPNTSDPHDDKSCPELGATCVYDNGSMLRCEPSCSSTGFGWRTYMTPVLDPACPIAKPEAASPCPTEGLQCRFSTCEAGDFERYDGICVGGVWQLEEFIPTL